MKFSVSVIYRHESCTVSPIFENKPRRNECQSVLAEYGVNLKVDLRLRRKKFYLAGNPPFDMKQHLGWCLCDNSDNLYTELTCTIGGGDNVKESWTVPRSSGTRV